MVSLLRRGRVGLHRLRRGHGTHRRHVQAHIQPRIVGHLRRVLRVLVFIDHVVIAGAVFVIRLGGALLDVLQLVVGAFNVVANHRAAHQTNQRGGSPAAAVANRIAGSASGQRTHQRARTGLGCLCHHGLVVAHLTRHGHLLHHRRAGNHPRQNVHRRCRYGRQGGCGDGRADDCFNAYVFHV